MTKTGHIPLATAFLACAMALGLFSCWWASTASLKARSTATNASSHGNGVVAKTVTSTKMRLVYIFGVEGSGHHYAMEALDGIFHAHPDLPKIQQGFLKKDPYYIPITMRESAAAFHHAREHALDDMRELARRAEEIPSPGTFQQLHGHSVPTGHGVHKVMQYSDPRLMAEAAEAESIDLRILYMKRPAKAILLANTDHRHFENTLGQPDRATPESKFMAYVRVLFTDIAVVQSFLAELDPAFVVCHDWSFFGDPDQARKIADTIAPNAEMASLVTEGLIGSAAAGSRHAGNETHLFDDVDWHVYRRS